MRLAVFAAGVIHDEKGAAIDELLRRRLLQHLFLPGPLVPRRGVALCYGKQPTLTECLLSSV
jgi:hypothetical protein